MYIVSNGLLCRYDKAITEDLFTQIEEYFYDNEAEREDDEICFPWLQDVPADKFQDYIYDEGAHFAQYSVERNEGEKIVHHPFSVICVEVSDLFVLRRSDYMDIIKQFPKDFHSKVKEETRRRTSSIFTD